MKKIVALVCCFAVVVLSAVFIFGKRENKEEAFLRVHIRANSNAEVDQAVKYKVKTAVVDFLTPKIAEGSTFEKAYEILKENLEEIEKVADEVLKENGFDYVSHAKLCDEYFPTRSYGEYTLESGFYDALIIELGSGEGNNWWCVVYPPLCFIGSEGSDLSNIKYKSKIVEIIKKFFN